jgi:hypothetical protein
MPGFQLSGPVRFALPGFLLRKIAGWRLRLIRPTVTEPLEPCRPDKRLRAIRHYLRCSFAGWRLRLIRPTNSALLTAARFNGLR